MLYSLRVLIQCLLVWRAKRHIVYTAYFSLLLRKECTAYLGNESEGGSPPRRATDVVHRTKTNLIRKEGKVILLTTHYMDEADVLADQVSCAVCFGHDSRDTCLLLFLA